MLSGTENMVDKPCTESLIRLLMCPNPLLQVSFRRLFESCLLGCCHKILLKPRPLQEARHQDNLCNTAMLQRLRSKPLVRYEFAKLHRIPVVSVAWLDNTCPSFDEQNV